MGELTKYGMQSVCLVLDEDLIAPIIFYLTLMANFQVIPFSIGKNEHLMAFTALNWEITPLPKLAEDFLKREAINNMSLWASNAVIGLLKTSSLSPERSYVI